MNCFKAEETEPRSSGVVHGRSDYVREEDLSAADTAFAIPG